MSRARNCDGMLCGGPTPERIYRVFAPPWWRLDRWAWWLTAARRLPRGRIDLGAGSVVRIYEDRTARLPRVPRAEA